MDNESSFILSASILYFLLIEEHNGHIIKIKPSNF